MHPGLSARSVAAAIIAIASLAACGGGGAKSTVTATATPMSEMAREQAALPSSVVAPIPKTVNCGKDQPVWVNMHTKSYHKASDPYYGRTKNGQYMCEAQAEQQGFHAAGSSHASSSASGHHKHKRHHRKGGSVSDQSQDNGSGSDNASASASP